MRNKLAEIREGVLAPNTREAYDEAWQEFVQFCKNRDPFKQKEEDCCRFLLYLCDSRKLSTGTMLLMRQGIARKFKEAKLQNPFDNLQVKDFCSGLLRAYGKPSRRVKALRENQIKEMMDIAGKSKIGRRNAALLAIGFSCALRRSEIVNLLVSDVKIHDDFSLTVLIRRSKTDQGGKGQTIKIPPGQNIRPGATLYKWLAVSGITEGPLFQTMKRGGNLRGSPMHHSDIPRLVKHYAALIGLDPKQVSGHSLRAGFVTSAAAHNARLDKIMEVTRHVQAQTVLKYIREENQLSNHAGESFL